MEKVSDRIYELISGDLHDKLTLEERKELTRWVGEAPEHREVYREIKHIKEEAHGLRREFYPDIEVVLKKVKGEGRRKYFLRMAWYKYAALFILPLGIALGLLFPGGDGVPGENDRQFGEVARPGELKAVLRLNGERMIRLEGVKYDSLILENECVRVHTDSNSVLCYTDCGVVALPEEVCENELIVPRGGEYQVVLSDGTKVWLNSASRLTFPERFCGGERRVKLSGEAFFEVAPDARQPFIVETGNLKVRVLGTRFNVMAYGDEDGVRTTLVEGSVEVISDGVFSCKLKPGEQAYNEGGRVEKRMVNLRLYTSWVEGKFVFSNTPLEEICRQVARWYNVEIFFANEELKKIRFTGAVIRFSPLEELIRMIESTSEVRFCVKDKTIVISK